MSLSQLKWIAAILVVLLVVWGGSELFSRGSDRITGSLTLPALGQADVDSITLVKGADSVVLVKQSSTEWAVNGHRAAATSVDDLFKALKDTVRPEVVAEAASSFARLQVDSAGGRWFRVFHAGKPIVALIVGARGTDYQSAYLRQPGSTRVYLWRGALTGLVDRRADDWRDKRIAALEPDSIATLEVERGTERYRLTRAGTLWHVNGVRTDSGAAARYLDRLKAITASGFATASEVDSTKALRPRRRFVARGGRGVLLSLAFDSTASGWVVRHLAGVGGEGATVYRMNTWDVDGVTPTRESLEPPKKPATPAPTTPRATPAPAKPRAPAKTPVPKPASPGAATPPPKKPA